MNSSRYTESALTSSGFKANDSRPYDIAPSEELPELDALWLDLTEKMPVLDEAKYRMAFFILLIRIHVGGNDHWLRIEKKALAPRVDSIYTKYQEVKKHLYP